MQGGLWEKPCYPQLCSHLLTTFLEWGFRHVSSFSRALSASCSRGLWPSQQLPDVVSATGKRQELRVIYAPGLTRPQPSVRPALSIRPVLAAPALVEQRMRLSERQGPMWCLQGTTNNSLECPVGSVCVAEPLRKGLKVPWDTAALDYLLMCIGLGDSLVCCSLGVIHIDF